jgi:hypothetical protein
MQQFTYRGHNIEIYSGYDGDQLFITKDGKKVYSARVHKGDSVSRIKQILG